MAKEHGIPKLPELERLCSIMSSTVPMKPPSLFDDDMESGSEDTQEASAEQAGCALEGTATSPVKTAPPPRRAAAKRTTRGSGARSAPQAEPPRDIAVRCVLLHSIFT